MSDDKQEMVTIEVPLFEAERLAEYDTCGPSQGLLFACRKALDARKSKYERWRERIKPYGEHFQSSWLQGHNHKEQADLMAAAPDLLEALMEVQTLVLGYDSLEKVWGLAIPRAIRKALPEDVADEVLK